MGGGWTRIGRAADLVQLWGSLPEWIRTWLLWLMVTVIGGAIWSRFSAWPFELLLVLAGIVVACVAGTAAAGKYLFGRPRRSGQAETYETWKARTRQDFLERLRADAVENRRRLGLLDQRIGPDQSKWIDPAPKISELVVLRETAVVLLQNRIINSHEDFHQFKENFDWWEMRTADAMKRAGATEDEISRFKVLGTYQVTGIYAWNEAHAKLRDILIEKVGRLETVSERLRGAS